MSKRVRRFDPSATDLVHVLMSREQGLPTMNRDQGYHLPAIYNQIIPPKSEATHGHQYVNKVRS